MRRLAYILLFLLAACGSSGGGGDDMTTAENTVQPGLVTRGGTYVDWSRVRVDGKRNLVVFMTPWCAPCRREQPHVETFARENPDIRVMYVVSGVNASRTNELANERKIAVDVYADPDGLFAEFYGVSSTPTLVLFDARGALIGSYRKLDELPDANAAPARKPVAVTDSGEELGTTYDVVVMATDTARARADLASAREVLRKAESHLSEWKNDSDISLLNENGFNNPVEVPDDLLQIINASKQVSAATGGAFDITWLPLNDLWRGDSPPTDAQVTRALEAVGSDKIIVEGSTVQFTHERTRIGLGGVAKGWIVDAVFLHLRKKGYENLIVNIGGDIRTAGQGPDGPWTFKLMDPFDRAQTLAKFDLQDGSVATSGNYLRYWVINGERYGHILDPRTGWPAKFNGSVSVFTRDCAMADALATALFVMGPDEGLQWAKDYPDVEVIYATEDGLRASFPLNE